MQDGYFLSWNFFQWYVSDTTVSWFENSNDISEFFRRDVPNKGIVRLSVDVFDSFLDFSEIIYVIFSKLLFQTVCECFSFILHVNNPCSPSKGGIGFLFCLTALHVFHTLQSCGFRVSLCFCHCCSRCSCRTAFTLLFNWLRRFLSSGLFVLIAALLTRLLF